MLIEAGEEIVVTLSDGFTVGSEATLTATQGEGDDAEKATASYSDGVFTVADDNEFETSDPVSVTITGVTNPDEVGSATVTVAQGEFTPATFAVEIETTDYTATDSTVPGSNQRLTLRAKIKVDERDAITVKFAKFGVGDIEADDVEILADDITGNPSSVSVSGTTVTLYFTDLNDGDTKVAGGDKLLEDQLTTITFLQRAGITLPSSSGTFDIEVSSDDTADDQLVNNRVTTERTVTVDPDKGKRGTEVTITGKGYAGNRAPSYDRQSNLR